MAANGVRWIEKTRRRNPLLRAKLARKARVLGKGVCYTFGVCGRYTLTKKQLRFASRFSREELQLFLKQRYNIAPTQDVPVIHIIAGELVSEQIRWGLQPTWSKAPIINAQSEGIFKKTTFRESVLHRRCLMPADGFYEWRGKTPFLFSFPNREPFYFAGIVDTWKSSDKPALECCCIITTGANEVVGAFHKRMPVILSQIDYDAWLDPATSPQQLEEILARPNRPELSAQAHPPLFPDGTPPPPPKPTQGELTFL